MLQLIRMRPIFVFMMLSPTFALCRSSHSAFRLVKRDIIQDEQNPALSSFHGYSRNAFIFRLAEVRANLAQRSTVLLSSISNQAVEGSHRPFPEVDSRGFHEHIFDENFGDFDPMKRW